jgi:drug/metabolite transporter (DMT)-like permease
VIGALQPALTLLVAGPLFGEQVGIREVALIGAATGGVVLVTIGSSGTPVWSLRGDLLAALSLLAWTTFFVVSKLVRVRMRAIEYMTAVTLVAAAVVTPIALLSGQPLGTLRLQDWLWLLVFLAAAQGGHLLIGWAHPQVDVSISSLLILAEPIVGVIAAFVILGEPITVLMVMGGVVVGAGLGWLLWRATRIGREEIAAAQA